MDADGSEGWSKRVLTLGVQPKQWGVGEYGRLATWNEWVFGDKHGQLSGLNSFVSKVVLNNLVSIDVKRIKDGSLPVEYLVDNYSNLCSVNSLCLIVNQLPCDLCTTVSDKLTDYRR